MQTLSQLQKFILLSFTAIFLVGLASCKKDDMADPIIPGTGEDITFDLSSVDNSGVAGEVVFEELQDGSTRIIIDVSGTSPGDQHPSHVHFNTAAEGGDVAIALSPVDGTTGRSETIVSNLASGTPISYDELANFDGYVNVHLSADDLATLVAQGDIGQNALTGEMTTYDLGSVSNPGISGKAIFAQRKNNETLVTLDLEGTPDGGSHPAHIHYNTAAEGGGIAVTINSVDGTSGLSRTNVAMTDDNMSLSYDQLVDFDGYINVHLSANDLATLVAQGDIGQNALTGNSVSFNLEERDVPGISGTVTFHERMNRESLAIIQLMGTLSGDHPAHIHAGSVATAPGGILITFTDVNDQGSSLTNIAADDNGDAVTFDMIAMMDAYVNVHQSISDLGTLVAQGNIGINAE